MSLDTLPAGPHIWFSFFSKDKGCLKTWKNHCKAELWSHPRVCIWRSGEPLLICSINHLCRCHAAAAEVWLFQTVSAFKANTGSTDVNKTNQADWLLWIVCPQKKKKVSESLNHYWGQLVKLGFHSAADIELEGDASQRRMKLDYVRKPRQSTDYPG